MEAHARNAAHESAGAATRYRRPWGCVAASIVAVFALTVLGGAGTAAADTPLQITVNGQPMASSGPPQLTASLLYDGGSEWTLTLNNSSSNPAGVNITEVDGTTVSPIHRVVAQSANPGDTLLASSGGISFDFLDSPVEACYEQNGEPQESFSCPTLYGGFGPGSSEEYVFDSNDSTESTPLFSSIDVKVTMGACVKQDHTTRQPASAADDCAQPGNTKIVTAKINQKTRSASFSYTAKFARTYVCELLYNKRVEHRTSCASAKGYAGLSPGTYYFLVWGVNKAGVGKKATVYGFKIGGSH